MKESLSISIDGQQRVANARTFSTGNTGFGCYGKIEIDGEKYQVSLNIIKLVKK